MMLRITCPCIVLLCCSFSLHALSLSATCPSKVLVHPHQHPKPDAVVHDVNRRVNESVARRQLLAVHVKDQCLTGNPIDDCWRCDPNWESNREHLADCAIGFGREALGGRGGNVYVVTDPSDPDPENPPPGTLRYGVIQAGPLWIVFSGNMVINLKYELLISSFKTIDGRGANVEITGRGCLIIDAVTNIIVHNVHIHHCKPSDDAKIRISPTQVSARGKSDGDGISILASSKIWIDHCALSYCTDGLIDVTEGSTAVTISNNVFTHHDKVMLLGHSDDFTADSGMQVTVAFNHFGEDLTERMPRCRFGYFHVVNNDYTQWGMYAVGGSAGPTINSQGNRYIAPQDDINKQVTKRMDTDESEWRKWNWRSEGDLMVNGAYFVTSGADISPQYAEASSMSPLSANFIDLLTAGAGVLVAQSRSDAGTVTNPPPGSSGGGVVTNPTTPGSSGGGIVTNPTTPGSSGGGVVTNPTTPGGSSGGTVMNPGTSGGDGSYWYPGQGSSGTVPGTSIWGYPSNGINYGSTYGSDAGTALAPMITVIAISAIAIIAFLQQTPL
ncbi:probable pectate lyase 5 isoform X2 [Rhodamnia argentea]|uniref:Pectate lyase n=1 Tax=Rhodamnia argentea TaxID=178133 RepID=A0ABM3HCN3_9MYRT|nr:probable pectate lyase 5 isoform X2 [Rhodamnia argentea]